MAHFCLLQERIQLQWPLRANNGDDQSNVASVQSESEFASKLWYETHATSIRNGGRMANRNLLRLRRPRPEWSDFSFERNGLSSFTFGMTAPARGVEWWLDLRSNSFLPASLPLPACLPGCSANGCPQRHTHSLSLFSQCQHLSCFVLQEYFQRCPKRHVLQVMSAMLLKGGVRRDMSGVRQLFQPFLPSCTLLMASRSRRRHRQQQRSPFLLRVAVFRDHSLES